LAAYGGAPGREEWPPKEATGTAAGGLGLVAPVHWRPVAAMGVCCLIGSRLGPIVVRHAPATPLRLLIAVAGLALAVKLGFDTYR